MVIVTHDLGVIAESADRVLVMYGGRVQEAADVGRLFSQTSHPYSQALMACQPQLQDDVEVRSIPGSPPDLTRRVIGCVFAPRCPRCQARCLQTEPDLEAIGPRHQVACHVVADEALSRRSGDGAAG